MRKGEREDRRRFAEEDPDPTVPSVVCSVPGCICDKVRGIGDRLVGAAKMLELLGMPAHTNGETDSFPGFTLKPSRS